MYYILLITLILVSVPWHPFLVSVLYALLSSLSPSYWSLFHVILSLSVYYMPFSPPYHPHTGLCSMLYPGLVNALYVCPSLLLITLILVSVPYHPFLVSVLYVCPSLLLVTLIVPTMQSVLYSTSGEDIQSSLPRSLKGMERVYRNLMPFMISCLLCWHNSTSEKRPVAHKFHFIPNMLL